MPIPTHALAHARPCTRMPGISKRGRQWIGLGLGWQKGPSLPNSRFPCVSPDFLRSRALHVSFPRSACSPFCQGSLSTFCICLPAFLYVYGVLRRGVWRREAWCGKACSMCLRGARKQARKQAFESAQPRGLEQETGRKGVNVPGVCSVSTVCGHTTSKSIRLPTYLCGDNMRALARTPFS